MDAIGEGYVLVSWSMSRPANWDLLTGARVRGGGRAFRGRLQSADRGRARLLRPHRGESGREDLPEAGRAFTRRARCRGDARGAPPDPLQLA